jgi:hypothetical protein
MENKHVSAFFIISEFLRHGYNKINDVEEINPQKEGGYIL